MIKIGVVDDEERWRLEIYSRVSKYFLEKNETVVIRSYSSGGDLLREGKEFDIVFMDIEMPDCNGIEVSENYKYFFKKCLIIILTTHTEMSRKGYKINVFRFLDKLDLEDDFKEALHSSFVVLNSRKKLVLNLKNIGKLAIPYDEIIFIETEGRGVLVHTVEEEFYTTDKISVLTELLENHGFCLTHRLYLVNINHIGGIKKKEIIMKNGMKVLLSSRKYLKVKKDYLEWKFKCGMG